MLYMRVMMTRVRNGVTTKVLAEAHEVAGQQLLFVQAQNVVASPLGPVVSESTTHQSQYDTKPILLERLDDGVFKAVSELGFVVDFILDNTTAEGGQGAHTVHVNVNY